MISSPTAITGEPSGATSQATSPEIPTPTSPETTPARPAQRRVALGPARDIRGRPGLGAHLHGAILRRFGHYHNRTR